MKIQIVNTTGKPWDTHILDEWGREIDGVVEIGAMKPNDDPTMTIYLASGLLDVVSEHVTFVARCPHCGREIQGKEK